jgi:UDP-N-acetylmuramoyl-tripeptide--D-alanyl-D-alanine ligase
MVRNASSVTVVGEVGRSTVGRMLTAVAETSAVTTPRPPVVVVLSRGTAKPDASGRVQSWAQALSSLDEAGVAIVSSDDSRFASLANATGARVVTFGLSKDADIRADDIATGSPGTTFTLIVDGEARRVALAVVGEHHVVNALAALACGIVWGVAVDDAVEALENLDTAGPSTMQMLRRQDGLLVIDDTVSSNVVSASAALKSLAVIGTEGLRTIAVLGPLEEAGDVASPALSEAAELSREAHDRVGRLVVRLNVRKLIVVGETARHIHNAAGLEGSWDGESVLVDTTDEAYDLLQGELGAGDVVLVKASRSAAFSSFAARLAGVPIPGGFA